MRSPSMTQAGLAFNYETPARAQQLIKYFYLNSHDETVVWHMGTRLEHMPVRRRAVTQAHRQQIHPVPHGDAGCARAAAQ